MKIFLLIISCVIIIVVLITLTARRSSSEFNQNFKMETFMENKITVDNLQIFNNNKGIFIYETIVDSSNSFRLFGKDVAGNSPSNVKLNLKLDGISLTKTVKINKEGTFETAFKNLPMTIEKIRKQSHKRLVKTYKGDHLPYFMYKSMITFMNCNPGYDLYYYDNDHARMFLKENFSEDVIDAFDCLIPGAFKADLFRLAELYINGGIYSDISMICVEKLSFDSKADLIIVKDCKGTRPHTIYNALIVAQKPKIEIFKYWIDEITKKVLEKYHPEKKDALSYTGPGMIGRLLNMFIKRDEFSEHIVGVQKYSYYRR